MCTMSNGDIVDDDLEWSNHSKSPIFSHFGSSFIHMKWRKVVFKLLQVEHDKY